MTRYGCGAAHTDKKNHQTNIRAPGEKKNYHLNFKKRLHRVNADRPAERRTTCVIEYKLDHCRNYRAHLSVSRRVREKISTFFFIIEHKSKGLEDVFAFEILIIYI